MKKNRCILLPILFALPLVGCNRSIESISDVLNSSEEIISSSIKKEATISLNEIKDINVFNEYQLSYIESENYQNTGYASGTIDWSRPTPINISWSVDGPNKSDINKYQFVVKESDKVVQSHTLDNGASSINITNLKMRTDYTCEVHAFIDDEEISNDQASLKIDQKGPRLMDIEGVDNMRDLGGNGIKQGLLYRSGRLSNEDGADKITTKGKETMLSLGIKTEIDLRRYDETGAITVSPLGENVTYRHLPMVYGGNNIATYKGTYSGDTYDNPSQIKEFFTILSDENNYPIDFHCSIGKDRTGCLAFLVEGLLGMDEEHLLRDYLFSNFSEIGSICKRDDVYGSNRYGQTINKVEGETIKEKVKNFLISETVGLTEEILNKVTSILQEQ